MRHPLVALFGGIAVATLFSGCASGAGPVRNRDDGASPLPASVPRDAKWLSATVTRTRVIPNRPPGKGTNTTVTRRLEVRSAAKVNRIRMVINSLPLATRRAPAPSCPARTTNTFLDIALRARRGGPLIASARVAYVSCAPPTVLLAGPKLPTVRLGEGQLVTRAIEVATHQHIATDG